MQVLTTEGLTRNQARGVEQVLIEKFGMKERTARNSPFGGGVLDNVVTSVSSNHDHYDLAKSFGEGWLKSRHGLLG